MQRHSTECRLLLVTPVFFILLQVALALHHHHSESYHDEKDSLHSFPTSYCLDQGKQDFTACLPALTLPASQTSLWSRTPDCPKIPVTVLIADPPQSRAPPVILTS